MDELGNITQDFGYGGSREDAAQTFIQAPAGGGLIAGFTLSEAGKDISQSRRGFMDCWAVRFDDQGNIIWEKRFGSGGTENFHWVSAANAPDGGFLLAATSAGPVGFEQRYPPINPVSNLLGFDLWLLRLDANGDTLWTRRYGGNYTDFPWTVEAMPQGGWIVGGYTNSLQGHDISQPPKYWTPSPSFPYPNPDAWPVRLDDQGNLLWERRYGGFHHEEFNCLLPLADGTLLAGGISTSFGTMMGERTAPTNEGESGWLVHIDAEGKVIRDWAFGALPGFTTEIMFLLPLPQGGLLIGCHTRDGTGSTKSEPSRGGEDGWVFQLDDQFNIVWEKTIGGSADDPLTGAVNGPDGVVYLGGFTRSPEDPTNPQSERHSPFRGDTDLWFVKLVPDEPLSLDDIVLEGQHLHTAARLSFDPPTTTQLTDLIIERGPMLPDGKLRFEAIAQMEAEHICGTANCEWIDRQPLPGSNFYRLAYRLTDGSRRYSNVIELIFRSHQSAQVMDFRLYPNPSAGPVQLQFESALSGWATFELLAADGRQIHRQLLPLKRGGNAFELEPDLPAGIYLLRLTLPDGTVFREKWVRG